MTEPWPYNQPIFRRSHRATSPDGQFTAIIDDAVEVSMSNPTSGLLVLSTGLQITRCNPSFIWSDDSAYLAVPKYVLRFGIFRRQRLLIVDGVRGRLLAAPGSAYYYQPESFTDGVLVVTKEPFARPSKLSWRIPADLDTFSPWRENT